MSEIEVSAKVIMIHEAGLHARPSVKLTKLAKGFDARIEIAATGDGPWIDAKSIVKVMATRVPNGALLHIKAAGPEAQRAIDAIVALIENDFEDRLAVSEGEA